MACSMIVFRILLILTLAEHVAVHFQTTSYRKQYRVEIVGLIRQNQAVQKTRPEKSNNYNGLIWRFKTRC